MKPILIFILKVIASLFAIIENWIKLIIAVILWDKKFIESENSMDIIWQKKSKNSNC